MVDVKRKVKRWTDDEIEYLEENVGKTKMSTMAKKLGRTEKSVSFKLYELGIGYLRRETGKLTARELAEALQVDTNVVIRWINNNDLKANHKAVRTKKKFYFIDINDFWKWAEKNKDKIDFYKIDKYALLPEPEWVDQQRKDDYHNKPKKRFQKWEREEELLLIQLAKDGEAYKEIGKRLNRTEKSIRHKIHQLRKEKVK